MVRYVDINFLPSHRRLSDPIIFDSCSLIPAFGIPSNHVNGYKKRRNRRRHRRRNRSYEVLKAILEGRLGDVVIPIDVMHEVHGVVSFSKEEYNFEWYESWERGFYGTDNYVVHPKRIYDQEVFLGSGLNECLRASNKDLTKKSKGEIAVLCVAWNFAEQGYDPKKLTNRYSSISFVSEDISFFDTHLQNKLGIEFFKNFKLKSSELRIYDINMLYTKLKTSGLISATVG